MSEPIKNQNTAKPDSYSPNTSKFINMMEKVQQAANYPNEFILPDKSTKIPPEIKHFGPAYVPFANEFSHFLDYTGQGYGFIYDGDWCKDRGYTIADVLSGHAMEPAQLFSLNNVDYLWKSAGFLSCHRYYADSSKGSYMSEQDMKEAIKYSLCTLEQPVIIPQDFPWFGCIVIGYKDNGNTLLIYGFVPYFLNMDNNASPKTEELSCWYNEDTSLFIAGKRENTIPLTDIYLEGFRRIKNCLHENIHGDKRHYYDEWEAFLRMSMEGMITHVKNTRLVPGGEQIPLGDVASDDDVWKFICEMHNNTWCDMAERRFYVMNLFRQAKEYFPEMAEDLKALDDHFWHTNEIMGGSETKGYNSEIGDPINAEIFMSNEVRERMADCVSRFREGDAEGLEMIQNLLIRYNILL